MINLSPLDGGRLFGVKKKILEAKSLMKDVSEVHPTSDQWVTLRKLGIEEIDDQTLDLLEEALKEIESGGPTGPI